MATYSDTFTGTNGTALNAYLATWVYINGDGAAYYGITTNAAATLFSGTSAFNTYRYNNTFAQDQYSECVIGNLGGNLDPVVILIVRADTGTTSSNHYRLHILESNTGNGGSKTFQLYKVTAGTPTLIGSSFTSTVSNGDTIRLEATGGATTTLVTKKNGTQIDSRTDSSSAFTSGQCGIGGQKTSGIRADSWGGGDLAAASAIGAAANYYSSIIG